MAKKKTCVETNVHVFQFKLKMDIKRFIDFVIISESVGVRICKHIRYKR